ncbi:MAG: tetratricopeptide repeat protein [Bacteroidota bacterium]
MSSQEAVKKISKLLKDNRLDEAIDQLIESGMGHEGGALKGRLSALKQQQIKGIIKSEDAQIERNQIQEAIQIALTRLDKDGQLPIPSRNRVLMGTILAIVLTLSGWGIGKLIFSPTPSTCTFELDVPDNKNFLIMIPSHQESLIGQTHSVLEDIKSLDAIPFDMAVDDQTFSRENRLNRERAIQKGSDCHADLISWLTLKPITQTVSMHYAWLDTTTKIQWIEKIGATNIELGSRLFDGELAGSIKSISQYFIGMGRFYVGNYERALADFEQVKPDTTIGQKFVLYYQGSCQRKLGEESRYYEQFDRATTYFQQAKQSFHQALKIDSRFAEALHDLALVYYYEHSHDSAQSLFEQVLKITERQDLQKKANLNLANLAVVQGRFDDASNFLRKITPDNQLLLNIQWVQSSILIEQKQYSEALGLIQQMQPQSEQDSLKVWNQLGIVLESLNRDKEALAIYDAIIDRYPDYLSAYQNRGNLHYHNQDFGFAEKDFRQLLDKDSNRIDAYFLLGRIGEKTDNPSKAKAYYRLSLQQKNSHLFANFYLAKMYEEEKIRDSMAYFYERAFALMPDSYIYQGQNKSIMMNNAAYVLGIYLDTVEIAERFLEEAIRLDDQYEGAYGSLAELYGIQKKENLFFSTLDLAISKGYDLSRMEYLEAEPYRGYWGDQRLISLIEKYPGMFPKDMPPELFADELIN